MSERPQNRHLKPYQPGQSGNPSGRPALPEALRSVHELTKDEVKRTISKYLRANARELAETKVDKDAPSLDVWLASGILKGIAHGDFTRLAFMLDRLIGKIPVEQDASENPWTAILEAMSASGIGMDQIVAHLAQKRTG